MEKYDLKPGEPVAVWTGRGTLSVASDGRHLEFDGDAWPERGDGVETKLYSFWRGLRHLDPEWTAIGEASTAIRAEARASGEAEARRAEESRLASERQRAAEQAARAELEAKFGKQPTWKRGAFQISTKDGPKVATGTLSPSGLFGIRRDDSNKAPDAWTLTHVPTGLLVARGRSRDLRILTARLEAVEGVDWSLKKLNPADLAPSAPLALAFKRTGDPLVLTERDHARIAREVSS